MLYVALPPKWLQEQDPSVRPIQLNCTLDEILKLNARGYNVYYYPNGVSSETLADLPRNPRSHEVRFIQAQDIDEIDWVLVDLDMKSGTYASDVEFLKKVMEFPCLPTRIVSTGGGFHLYWRVVDLTAMSFLRLSRRLCRYFNSDPAVAQIKQLMRVYPSLNTKIKDKPRSCELLEENDNQYTSEELDKVLPPITAEDEQFCKQHFDKVYNIENKDVRIDDKLPKKFRSLLRESQEVRELFAGDVEDRSKADYRLAHIMLANEFTRDEALSVLVNCKKALERAPIHRIGYATGIVEKVWEFNESEDGESTRLSSSVRDILQKSKVSKAIRFPCWDVFDGTEHGFHLTEVLGLVGGSGSGKTTLALNYFYHFTRLNPEYVHMFVSLEQPVEEIALRWEKITQGNDKLHDKVHVLGNYNEDGSYRHLSLLDIQEYLLRFEKETGKKVGSCVIDHIGVLRKANKNGESEGLIEVCQRLKAFAKATRTFLVIQSQTSREKAGIGDVELNKDAAFGTSMFEWFVDYVVTTWTPLKRVYDRRPDMTVSAFKYCKIRHKDVRKDRTKEDVVHMLKFDPGTERLRLMTQDEEESFEFLNDQATKLRNKDRKREPTRHTKIEWASADEESA